MTEPDFLIDDSIFKENLGIYINRAVVSGTTRCHSHDFIEIAYIRSGTGVHRLNRTETQCGEGDYYIINYDAAHEFLSAGGMLVYNCIFKPDFIDYSMLGCRDFNKITSRYLLGEILPFLHVSISTMKFHDAGDTGRIFLQMYEEYTRKRKGYAEMLRSLLIQLLIGIMRETGNGVAIPCGSKENLNGVLEYIADHFNMNVPLEQLAMMAFLSPAYFCRQFKAQMGMTVTEFTQKLRIDEAKRLLVGTDKTVEEISDCVGYQDTRYFSKIFACSEGLTPTKFRKRYGGGN